MGVFGNKFKRKKENNIPIQASVLAPISPDKAHTAVHAHCVVAMRRQIVSSDRLLGYRKHRIFIDNVVLSAKLYKLCFCLSFPSLYFNVRQWQIYSLAVQTEMSFRLSPPWKEFFPKGLFSAT